MDDLIAKVAARHDYNFEHQDDEGAGISATPSAAQRAKGGNARGGGREAPPAAAAKSRYGRGAAPRAEAEADPEHAEIDIAQERLALTQQLRAAALQVLPSCLSMSIPTCQPYLPAALAS